MTLSSAYMELFIRGEMPGGNVRIPIQYKQISTHSNYGAGLYIMTISQNYNLYSMCHNELHAFVTENVLLNSV